MDEVRERALQRFGDRWPQDVPLFELVEFLRHERHVLEAKKETAHETANTLADRLRRPSRG